TANGVVVSNGLVTEQNSVIERISATEVIVAWRDDRNDASLSTGQDYFFNKLLISDGSKVLINDVVLVSDNNLQTNLRLLSDGSGNAFAIWQDPRISTQNADIYVQKINNNGTLAWTANGMNITAIATNNQSTPRIISDGVGGIIATWDDNRNATADQDIYAQRIDKDGNIKWTAGGIAVSAVSGSNQRSPVMTTDGNSGAIIAWQDLRTSATTSNDIYTQRIDSNGVAKWTANGILVCNAAGSQPNSATGGFSINDDGVGGAIIVWDDARISTSDLDIFAQRVTADGNILWSTNNGVAIATKSSSNQRIPTVLKSTGNSLLIAWADSRTSTNGEIYASKLLLTGLLPVTFTNISAIANSQSIVVNWQTSNEVNTKQFTVQRSADGSTFTNIGSVQANGVGGKYAFTDNAPIQGNNYYRIQSVDKDGYTQFSTIALAKNLSTTISKLRIYPNPAVNGTLQVQLNNYTLGKYFIKISDVNGRTLQQENISILNTLTTKNIQLSSTIQTGSYVLQVVDEQGNVIESKAFIKQ
ncbi:MAG: T9SS type A sorting domain-containing protein, partial [Chitinophagaceae bacterium]